MRCVSFVAVWMHRRCVSFVAVWMHRYASRHSGCKKQNSRTNRPTRTNRPNRPTRPTRDVQTKVCRGYLQMHGVSEGVRHE